MSQTPEIGLLTDLRDRLARADATLQTSAAEHWEPVERIRLQGKADGVRLAISYLNEVLRVTRPELEVSP